MSVQSDAVITGTLGVTGITTASGGVDGTLGAVSPASAAVTTLAASDTVSITRTTAANSYTNDIASSWTPTADMAAGGSNGIYAISNVVEDVQNAYALRGRTDLRTAVEDVSVNQLHAFDACLNLNETYYYYVDDNISLFGGAVHGSPAGGIGGQGTGALGGATLNVFFGMWGNTATTDVDVETNFIKVISHAGTTVDYGLNIESSSDMDAGILLNNHASNSPATMDVGIEMISAASKMVSGIDMSQASFTGADFVLSNAETIDNVTNGVVNVTGNLQVFGATLYAGTSASTDQNTYVLDATPDMVVTTPATGQIITWTSDTAGDGASTLSVDGVVDTLQDRAGNATGAGDVIVGPMQAQFDGTNWRLIGI